MAESDRKEKQLVPNNHKSMPKCGTVYESAGSYRFSRQIESERTASTMNRGSCVLCLKVITTLLSEKKVAS